MSDDHDRVRLLFPDLLGLDRGKYLPRAHAHRGTNFCLSVFAIGHDRDMSPVPGAGLDLGFPDMHGSVVEGSERPGWEERTVVAMADLEHQGNPLGFAPREVLRRAIQAWEGLGQPKVGIELEAYMMEPNGDGGWKPIDTPGARVYGTGMSVDPSGVITEIIRTAEASEIPIESVNSEYDTPQFELTLVYDDPMKACDDAFLFRVIAREIAARKGLHCTFMGRPLGDRGGNGLHVNLSVADKGDKNLFDDPSTDDGISEMARHAIGGILAHHEGMAAVLAPTVNAYKRLKPGMLCGYWANWAGDNRNVTVRVPVQHGAATRLEHRTPDGACVPHLATAAVLQAARLGVAEKIEPPDPQEPDGLENPNTERCVPPSLGAALDALEADSDLVEALGKEFVDAFMVLKRAEWDRWEAAVTDWELNEYLPYY